MLEILPVQAEYRPPHFSLYVTAARIHPSAARQVVFAEG
jgi:hypothetical protein